jgi:hypothetical protein
MEVPDGCWANPESLEEICYPCFQLKIRGKYKKAQKLTSVCDRAPHCSKGTKVAHQINKKYIKKPLIFYITIIPLFF